VVGESASDGSRTRNRSSARCCGGPFGVQCPPRTLYILSQPSTWQTFFFFSSRRRHTRSVSAFLLNRSSDLIKMIGVSNLQSFIASMTQKLTLSDISDESKNYLDKAGITTACLRIKSKWTAGGK